MLYISHTRCRLQWVSDRPTFTTCQKHTQQCLQQTYIDTRTCIHTHTPLHANVCQGQLMAMIETYIFQLESCDMAPSSSLCRHPWHTTAILINHAAASQFHWEPLLPPQLPPPFPIGTQLSQKAFSSSLYLGQTSAAVAPPPSSVSHPIQFTLHTSAAAGGVLTRALQAVETPFSL